MQQCALPIFLPIFPPSADDSSIYANLFPRQGKRQQSAPTEITVATSSWHYFQGITTLFPIQQIIICAILFHRVGVFIVKRHASQRISARLQLKSASFIKDPT